MSKEHFYDVTVEWSQGRKGIMSSEVLPEKIEVATPPQFPAGVEGVWSPEHLLVAAVNSCLMTTFLAISENFKLPYRSFKSKAVGKLEIIEGKYMISEILLSPVVEIEQAEDLEKAVKVLHKSEAACLISNSIKAKIIFEPDVQLVKQLRA